MTLTPIISDPAIGYLYVLGTLGVGVIVYIPLRMGWRIKPVLKVLDWIEARLQVSIRILYLHF